MKKLTYQQIINAPANVVYRFMLGLDSITTYQQWTAIFNPTSTFEGNWEKGSKMYFVGTREDGKRAGMISEIADNVPNKFVSIRHYGMLQDDAEITTGPEVDQWAGCLENYLLSEQNGVTTLVIETDAFEDYTDYFNQTWPNALLQLKQLIES